MPVFNAPMQRIDAADPVRALKTMENHIRSMQEQLEFTLSNLDSSNIREIETDKTNITSSGGGVTISGDSIDLSGKKGERFRVGYDKDAGLFRFEVRDAGGASVLYLNSEGELVITKNATLSIDCGEWG